MTEKAKIVEIVQHWKSLKTQCQKALFLKKLKDIIDVKTEEQIKESLIALNDRATQLLNEIKSQKQLETPNPVS